MKTIVIYHRADFDGIFSREIARRYYGDRAEYVGWDYGDAVPSVPADTQLVMIDISVEPLMAHPHLIWIDHHQSAIEKFPAKISGYRIDGVAACRLAWQWFFGPASTDRGIDLSLLPGRADYVDRVVSEPLAVRLAGEYDVWDKRDPRAELFQHGLRSQDLGENMWSLLLAPPCAPLNGQEGIGEVAVDSLLEAGKVLQYSRTRENESVIKHQGFTIRWEGLTFIACNSARFNSHLFTAALRPEHDACLGFCWDGGKGLWKVSLYGVPGKPDIDCKAIAVRYGGGGHKQACGFQCKQLPFPLLAQADTETRGAA